MNSNERPQPYFSIVVPMYNRERFIARAINSCLKQDFSNFELIVVDDGSTDQSVKVVNEFTDVRIKQICHDVNRGVGPARNSGIAVARGEWIVLFDSDDELLPEALSIIHTRSLQLDGAIPRMQFMGLIDTGELSPNPPLSNKRWNYVEYIKWMESTAGRRQDTMPVIRREAFRQIQFYDNRTLEGPFHMDFMKLFDAWTFPDVISFYHQDAENQLTKVNPKRAIEGATDQALSGEHLLKNHGEALRLHAPHIYRKQISGLATLFFLSGNRSKGIKYSLFALANNFISVRVWIILIAGLVGAKPLAWAKTFRSRLD